MKKISCKKAGRLMMLAVYGEADRRSCEILRAHTSICPGCAAELKSFEKLRADVNFRARDHVSGELLSAIKSCSSHIITGEKRKLVPGRLTLRPVLAIAIIGLIIFSFFKLISFDYSDEIAMHEDSEYRLIDERLLEAENSLYSINIELLTGLYDF